MEMHALPPRTEMLRAVQQRDGSYEGIFVLGVRTTGIFCRPGCPARTPKPENVEFFGGVRDALFAGFRPCRRCRPLEAKGEPPEWLVPLLLRVEDDPVRRWTDQDLRDAGVDPTRVRRWFQQHHGLTFHGYLRARRIGQALTQLRKGDDMLETAFDAGYESASGFAEAFGKIVGLPPGKGRDTQPVTLTRFSSPLGPMVAAAVEEGLCLLEFVDRRMLETQWKRLAKQYGSAFTPGEHPHLTSIQRELVEYFDGKRKDFETPLAVAGTPFQEQVWAALRTIPYGETWSYGEMAERIGRKTAVRAVGRANGDNRLAIVIPCHRVVGADGQLTGYGGGVWRKKWMLELEQSITG